MNNNNIVVIVLAIVIGILSGVGLLFGIGNAVSVAVGPLSAEMGEIAGAQKQMAKNGGSNGDVEQQLAAINQRLASIEAKLNNGAAAGNNRYAPQPQMPPQEDMNKVYDIPVGTSPILGNKNAPVTIVEFSDFQCPFCARFYPPVLETLKAYPTQVRLIIKNFPLSFHPNALPAAKLALAANEQGKYFQIIEELLNNGGASTDDKIKEYAKKLGLNYNKLVADLKNNDAKYQAIIANDQNLGGQVAVQGTPTFFINGKKTNARDVAAYKAEIDKILKK